jgi:hypothetical protein
MRMKWVLIGFACFYLLFALSFLPTEKVLPGPVEEAWEMLTGVLWGVMTLVSISLLEVVGPLVAPFVSGGGLSRMHAEEGLLAAILIGIAAYSAVCLRRGNLTPGRRGTYAFLLLLALTVAAMVRFTLYSWGHFGS